MGGADGLWDTGSDVFDGGVADASGAAAGGWDGSADDIDGGDAFGGYSAPEPVAAAPAAKVTAAVPAVAAAAAPGSAIAEFNRKFRELCEGKDSKEREEASARRTSAKTELSRWQAEKDAQRQARKLKNRADDEAKKAELRATLTGETWKRVATMIDSSAPSTEGRDPARMRELLIHLKSNPLAEGH